MGRTLGTWIVMAALLAMPAAAEERDHHVSADPAQHLFRASPFAHGYIHGYESGFAQGDEDIHFRHEPRRLEGSKEYKHADRGYRSGYGDRQSFREGYRAGLVAGYEDARSGAAFRAFEELRRLAAATTTPLVDMPDVTYDRGFLRGYRAARATLGANCEAPEGLTAERYCAGFEQGYALGVADTGAQVAAQNRFKPALRASDR